MDISPWIIFKKKSCFIFACVHLPFYFHSVLPFTPTKTFSVQLEKYKFTSRSTTKLYGNSIKSANSGKLDISHLNQLYPPAKLNRNGTLQVDSLHTIYYEEYGQPRNKTSFTSQSSVSHERVAVSLHGGPGAGCFPKHAQFFNPDLYERIVLFDQRGCGKSTPKGETVNNTILHLVHDLELLRIHLNIDKFDVVLGGSWGSTLAIAYAQQYPERVGSLVLRGICLFRKQEIDWLFGKSYGSSTDKCCLADYEEMVDRWSAFQSITQGDNHDINNTRNTLHLYYQMLMSDDAIVRAIAAKQWFRWEMEVSSLNPSSIPELKSKIDMDATLLWDPMSRTWRIYKDNDGGMSQLEASQAFVNSLRRWPSLASPLQNSLAGRGIREVEKIKRSDEISKIIKETNVSESQTHGFVPAQAILTCFYSVNQEHSMAGANILSPENIDKIRHIPCIAVQGAQDLICPLDSALDLKEVWPEIELRIIGSGMHSMYDPPITDELIKATDRLALYPRDCFE